MAGMLHLQNELVRHLLKVVRFLLVPLRQSGALPALHGSARHG